MARPHSRQYASMIFYHNEGQRLLAVETMEQQAAELEATIYTEIVPFTQFTLAEGYHQKYYLTRTGKLMQELAAIYPNLDDLVNSTAVARINGYAGGHGSLEAVQQEIETLELAPEIEQQLLELVEKRGR